MPAGLKPPGNLSGAIMSGASRISNVIRRAGSRRAVAAKIIRFGIAACALSAPLMLIQAMAPPAEAAQLDATARIQALLDTPVHGVVNLPSGTFTIRPALRLKQGEKIIGHHTTLRVAGSSGDYAAVLASASAGTDLSGLTITGVTFDQNPSADPIRSVSALYHGKPRFVILVSQGTGITVTGNTFLGTNNVDTIVTGSATHNVTISGNEFLAINTPDHDHSSIYTSGTGTVIRNNTFIGTAMYDSAALEVHGDQVSGYYKAANIVSSDTTFSRNTVVGAANPVDLWSTVSPGLYNVTVSGNVLNRNLSYWSNLLRHLGGQLPAACYTQQVIRDVTSRFPFSQIAIHGNSNLGGTPDPRTGTSRQDRKPGRWALTPGPTVAGRSARVRRAYPLRVRASG
jgi:hypothetical protein